jgi:nucleotide-binding universal stress UspA family protein
MSTRSATRVDEAASIATPLHPITSVIAATDLQNGSTAVLETAAAIARSTGATLHVVHVVTPDAVPRRLRVIDPDAIVGVMQEAERALPLQVRPLAGKGLEMGELHVQRAHSVHAGILVAAKADAADLIVMGSHARPGVGMRLGSAADRVLRTATVPVLVVRGTPHFPLERAAVLTDFSAPAAAGLRLALSWLPALGLSEPGTRLDVIHAIWPELPEDAGRPPRADVGRVEDEIARATALVQHPPASVQPRVVFSCYPDEAAIEAARTERYQLIVVGTHGHGPIARALLGSVALGVMHASPCPVLAVPVPLPLPG